MVVISLCTVMQKSAVISCTSDFAKGSTTKIKQKYYRLGHVKNRLSNFLPSFSFGLFSHNLHAFSLPHLNFYLRPVSTPICPRFRFFFICLKRFLMSKLT